MKFRLETLRDLPRILKELSVGLRALTFGDNFDGFETAELTVAAGASVKVRNQLTITPTRYIIIWSKGGTQIGVSDATGEDWDSNFIYFKNYGSASVTFRAIVLR